MESVIDLLLLLLLALVDQVFGTGRALGESCWLMDL